MKMLPLKSPLSKRKYLYILYALFALAFGALLISVGFLSNHLAKRSDSTGFPALADMDFSLTSHTGAPIRNTDLLGTPTIIYFGFTYCPDVCPTTLSLLADLVNGIGTPEAYQIVLVSIDPTRDTAPVLNDYLSLFDADILGLTGSEQDIDDVLRRFGVYRAPADDGLGNVTIDHTASVFLFYADGRMKGTISPAEPYEFARQKLVALKN